MPLAADAAVKGEVRRVGDAHRAAGVGDSGLAFHPVNTNYEIHFDGTYDGPLGRHVRGNIRVRARKVHTATSGGSFTEPVLGSPRIIQGRVLSADEKTIVVKAGASYVVELPTGADAVDLRAGDLVPGAIVNVTALPGATFELAAR